MNSSIVQIPYQNIPLGMSTKGQVDMVIHFLEKYLPGFPAWFSDKCFTNPNETKFTYELCKYLSTKKQKNSESLIYPFEFFPETPQKANRKTDLGVHINALDTETELIYCIEAKRLPTAKVNSEREKEYVIGNLGGINRFKLNLHGINDQDVLMPRNAIVGYVQNLTFLHWHTKINDWINTDTNWGEEELLHKVYFDVMAKLESDHLRINGDKVKLTHFWVFLGK